MEFVSKFCRIPSVFLQIQNPMDFRLIRIWIQLLFLAICCQPYKSKQMHTELWCNISCCNIARHRVGTSIGRRRTIAIYLCLYRIDIESDRNFQSDSVFDVYGQGKQLFSVYFGKTCLVISVLNDRLQYITSNMTMHK